MRARVVRSSSDIGRTYKSLYRCIGCHATVQCIASHPRPRAWCTGSAATSYSGPALAVSRHLELDGVPCSRPLKLPGTYAPGRARLPRLLPDRPTTCPALVPLHTPGLCDECSSRFGSCSRHTDMITSGCFRCLGIPSEDGTDQSHIIPAHMTNGGCCTSARGNLS
jgi:hypothetical protein